MRGPRTLFALALAAVCLAGAVGEALARTQPPADGRRNHLSGEASPYLQMHVYNPVDWYPWGDEALARARAENKPIFLSVGYSSCYWCHVMERKVFSDPAIAELLNASFVSVKVDREERPDIDELYMQATLLLTGSGGWPNSVFLTPEGKPFFAGTYFPPESSPGRPGFPGIVKDLATRWKEEPAQVRGRAQRVAAAISERFTAPTPPDASFDPRGLLTRGVASLADRFDAEHGGFGEGTRFPSPPQLELLLAAQQRGVPGDAEAMLRKTLNEMAWGGIRDHLAGGFHRYATDPSWSVPHFEKMLYDNAQLLGLYARAHEALGDPLYRTVALETAAYLAREMTDPAGGLYSAQDAESEQREGRSYLWTEAEIREALGEDADAFLAVYTLAPLHPDRAEQGVLRIRPEVARAPGSEARIDALAPSRAKLLAVRDEREQPRRDEKILAAWNGLAIRGLVDAGVALDRPDYFRRAARAANFVLTRLTDDFGNLHRAYSSGRPRAEAVLDDYAFLADGLVALYSATGDRRWLKSARMLADRMLSDLEGPAGTGFFLARARPDLFVRPRVLSDGVKPSGNTVALRVLRDLGMMTGEARYRQASDRTVTALGGAFQRAPASVGTAVRTLAMGPQLPAPPPTQEAGNGSETPSLLDRLPTGRDFVKGQVRRHDSGEVKVALQIAEGWHVNANPASLEFLIPTRVAAAGGAEIEVEYPEGNSYHPRFSLEPLSVYEGEVEIDVRSAPPSPPLRKGAGLDLTFQACDDSSCLPPETVRLTVP